MRHGNVIGNILYAVTLSCIYALGVTGCSSNDSPAPLEITTSSLPSGTVNQPYSASVSGSGGVSFYTWSVTPALPANLSFDTTTGAITGTPVTAGTSSLTFTLQDSGVNKQTAQKTLTLTINTTAAVLSITTTSLPNGNVSQAYSQPVQATGGTGALTWSIAAGTLPQNLSLNSATGVIAGTPTTAGTSSFTVRVADTAGQAATQALSILINPTTPPNITTTSLPNGNVGQAYNQTVQATGGIGALTWSIVAGTLPQNLSLNSASGVIAGTPTAAVTSPFTVRVADTAGQAATQALSILINPATPPNITTTTLPGGTVGQAYSQALQATGGTGTLVWSLSGGSLPANLALSSAGTISGTPTNNGTSNFTVKVTDALSQSDTQPLSIIVSAALTITTNSLPNAKVGNAYNQTLQTSGGVAPFTWSVTPALPTGLNLNSSTGQITGTPAAGTAGMYSRTYTVQDSSTPTHQTANKVLSLTINP